MFGIGSLPDDIAKMTEEEVYLNLTNSRRFGLTDFMEELVRWVKLLYQHPKSKVRSVEGISKSVRVSVGVHQERAVQLSRINVINQWWTA